ncbi:putative uncharacterized protein [Pseudomonas sp. StFLB209]|uniref:hypothetical protein n=1 Tax=Pseudomonas sp. StFLB209 TaxID=1028989 RepID=UPI0004F8DA3A|nr:hypothetical protein [Pseudomonas sp. StFLB209]BAP41283.1 putative uncharacterized protein [Pseudomonas sp. StFLB209]
MSQNPVGKLLQSINKSERSSELFDKLGEVALDKFLDNDLIKEIPIIGTVISLLKAGDDFRAYAFARKIIGFLQEVETVTVEERDRFFEKHCQTPEQLTELGETTLMALDKVDHPTLAQMYGRAFALMLKDSEAGKLLFEQYSYIIKNMSPYLLRNMGSIYKYSGISTFDTHAAHELCNYGLMEQKIFARVTNKDEMQRTYMPTEYGRRFYDDIIRPFQ